MQDLLSRLTCRELTEWRAFYTMEAEDHKESMSNKVRNAMTGYKR